MRQFNFCWIFTYYFLLCYDIIHCTTSSEEKHGASTRKLAHPVRPGGQHQHRSTHVAICVIGQVSRMIPSLLTPFLKDNSKFSFTLFYMLQAARQKPWKGAIYKEPRYVNLTTPEIHAELTKLYSPLQNVVVAAVNESIYFNLTQWRDRLQGKVNSMRSYDEHGHVSALNMYSKYSPCADLMQEHEQSHEMTFDYFILGREDLYFYHRMDLSSLLPLLRRTNGDGDQTSIGLHCDYLSKICLDWCGVNLRFPIMTRDVALKYLRTKMDYYKSFLSVEKNNRPWNTEALDRWHLQNLSVNVCKLPIDDYPVTAVRLIREGDETSGDDFCFFAGEFKDCVPAHALNYALAHLCPGEKRNYDNFIVFP
eukprot:gene25027-32618_t